MTRSGHRLAFVLFGLAGVAACYGPPIQPAPRLPWDLPAVLDTVHDGTVVRFVLEGREFTGTLETVTADSFTIDRFGRDTTIARAAPDTVWVRGARSYQGTAIGLGLGLAAAALILLTRRGYDDGYRGAFALRVGLVLLGFGALGDVVTSYSWTPVSALPMAIPEPEEPDSTDDPGAGVDPTPIPRAAPTDTVP